MNRLPPGTRGRSGRRRMFDMLNIMLNGCFGVASAYRSSYGIACVSSVRSPITISGPYGTFARASSTSPGRSGAIRTVS